VGDKGWFQKIGSNTPFVRGDRNRCGAGQRLAITL
jgi:hypothetical protein